MTYKFHADGHGEVVAEAKNEDLESWVGLHYPAADIPQQARKLYRKNLVRLIADVQVQHQGCLQICQEKLVNLWTYPTAHSWLFHLFIYNT